jgi:hypothetical protein
LFEDDIEAAVKPDLQSLIVEAFTKIADFRSLRQPHNRTPASEPVVDAYQLKGRNIVPQKVPRNLNSVFGEV